MLYRPWGETRFTTGTTPTTWRFTGQREDVTIGLYFYNARYLDPQLGRFTQPDTIVPDPGNPQALNRYSYVLNNSIRYTDPSGHAQVCADGDEGGGCGTGARTSHIWRTFAGRRSPLLDYYAILHQLTQARANGASAIELEALAGAAESAYAAGSAWLPQHQFDPAMVVEPASLVSLGGAITSGGMRALRMAGGSVIEGAKFGFDARVGRYRDLATGRFVSAKDLPWPGNRGFAGNPVDTPLARGTVIDRYGSLTGQYAGTPGASISERGMAPGAEGMQYTRLEVMKSLTVPGGPAAAAPGFGADGGADLKIAS